MIKCYCDVCEIEVPRNYVSQRYKLKQNISGRKLEAEVMLCVDGVWNSGALCESCMRHLLAVGKEPPRAEKE